MLPEPSTSSRRAAGSRRSVARLGVVIPGLILLTGLSACVTERITHPSRPVMPPTPAIPTDPPRFTTRAIGSIRYDGVTLPIVSPDGTFIAVQVGRPPSWAGVLATAGDPLSSLCRIAIHLVADGTVLLSDVLPPRGLLLGRSADERGFLVEEPQPDGSRRIGRCSWLSGAIEWLVDEPGVCCAHAIELRDGTLAYTRRAVGAPRAELVIRLKSSPAGAEPVPPITLALPDATLLFPLTTPAQGHIGVIAASRDACELVCVSLEPEGPAGITTRCRLDSIGGARQAFRSAAGACATPPDAEVSGAASLRDMFQIAAERFGGAVLVNARDGQVVRLADRAVATFLALPEPQGMLVTRADLAFLAPNPGAVPIQVSVEPLVCRGLWASAAGFSALCFGPARNSPEPALIVTEVGAIPGSGSGGG
ncbi:MAG: hypothetical protein AB7K52_00320 [Phycisphaerales bacterium]